MPTSKIGQSATNLAGSLGQFSRLALRVAVQREASAWLVSAVLAQGLGRWLLG